MSPQKNAWQIHSDHQQIQIISKFKSKDLSETKSLIVKKSRSPAGRHRRGLLDELKNPPASLTY